MSKPKGRNNRQYRRLQWRRSRRDHFRSLGLTHDGQPRKRGTWHRYRDLDKLSPSERAVQRVQRWRNRERYKKGLSQNGLPQGNVGGRPRTIHRVEIAYRELRAAMNITRPDFLTDLERSAA